MTAMMRRHKDGMVFCEELNKVDDAGGLGLIIDTRRRFVDEDERGAAERRSYNRDAALHPEREIDRLLIEVLEDLLFAKATKGITDDLELFRSPQRRSLGDGGEKVLAEAADKESGRLMDHRRGRAALFPQSNARKKRLAPCPEGWLAIVQGRERTQKRRFSGAGGTDQNENAPSRYSQIDLGEDDLFSKGHPKPFEG